MDGLSSYIPNPSVVSTELDDDESVLLDLNTRRYYTLNETGVVIWRHISDGRSIDEVKSAVLERFEVSVEEAESCVVEFVTNLEKEGLVSRA